MECEGCERCGDNFEIPVLLPMKEPGEKSYEIICEDCALKSSAFCLKHKEPHLRFIDDGTTACKICIEEMITENKAGAEEIYLMLQTELPLEEIENLNDWAQGASLITGNSITVCILRAVITKALRLNVDMNEVIKRIIKAKSVDLILPNLF